jgi:predicted MFS family arabinose efflux permease
MATSPAGASAPLTAAQEWRRYWPLVLAAMMGVSFGSIPIATLGLFIDPLQGEFGWTSAQISLGVTVFALISLPATPLAGVLADRFGGRRVAIPGLVLCGITFAAFAGQTGWFGLWLAVWAAYTLASVCIRSLVWNRTISTVFSAGRGLALAIVVCGLSLPLVVAPPLTEWLISLYGWRTAYVALGLGWAGLALALVVPLFKAPQSGQAQTAGEKQAAPPPPSQGGLSVAQALRDPRTLRIAGAIALQALVNAAVGIHLVPLLVIGGISRMEAASFAAVLGIANLAGNLATGWLTDRISSPLLPLAVYCMPALGFAALLNAGGSTPMILLAILFLGLGGGGALQLGMYLTTRYAGVRNFATIYGLINSLQTVTSGIGPIAAAFVFDATGNYAQFLWAGIPVYILSGLLVFGLGRYPDHPPPQEEAAAEQGP